MHEITDYDYSETSDMIDKKNPKTLADLGFELPKAPPTTVISIRLPNHLLNVIRAFSSQNDLPYQSVIKLFLEEEVARRKLIK